LAARFPAICDIHDPEEILMTKALGIALVFVAMATALTAGNPTPEIDASTGAAAIALLTGGVLVLRGRRKN
jgi:hypothetical protein